MAAGHKSPLKVRPRRRLGVALLLDEPVATEVDALRRALGDGSLGRVAPHLTLVPPVNVAERDFGEALAVLRRAAASHQGPLTLALGPAETFHPLSPVVYLAVGEVVDGGGSDLEALAKLRRRALTGPLARPGRWPWVPHVTVLDEAPVNKIEAATYALGSYRVEAVFDRVVVLEERGGVWGPIADAVLGRPPVIGRGGLDLEITEGRLVAPDVLAMIEKAGQRPTWEATAPSPVPLEQRGHLGPLGVAAAARVAPETLVLAGRRGGEVVGVAAAWLVCGAVPPVQVCVLVSPSQRGIGVGRALLRALESSVRARSWPAREASGHGPATFYARCGGWAKSGTGT